MAEYARNDAETVGRNEMDLDFNTPKKGKTSSGSPSAFGSPKKSKTDPRASTDTEASILTPSGFSFSINLLKLLIVSFLILL